MPLIDQERDDAAMLRAEDEAIREAEAGQQPVPAIPTGEELAKLIEDLDAASLQQG